MKCQKCNLSFIEEEHHICRKAKGFHIKNDILWLSDGITEYPLKLSKINEDIRNGKIQLPKSNMEKTTADETEPEVTPRN